MQETPQGGNSDYDFLFKLLLIGNSGVGKSCMLMRYAENSFTSNFYNTIGVDFWDTAGQDRFKTITCSYYRGAHGIIIVYDVTDRDSFDSVRNWMSEIEKYAQENVTKLIVGNKCDMDDSRKVKYEEGQELARQYNINYIETSAKNANNIEIAFKDIAKTVLDRVSCSQGNNSQAPQKNLKLGNTQQISQKKTRGCC